MDSGSRMARGKMKQSVDSFLNFMAVERGVSRNTLAAYRNDLYQMVDYLESNGRGWRQVDGRALSAYLLELHDLEYSDATRARKLASAKSLFGFLLEEGIVDKDPSSDLSSPRLGRSLPEPLTVDDVEKLLSAAGSEGNARVGKGPGHGGANLRQWHARQRDDVFELG